MSITRVSGLGGILALTLIISTQVHSLSWAHSPFKASDPMPAIARPLSTKTSTTAEKPHKPDAASVAADPLSSALTQLLQANQITPIIQVRQAHHSKIDVVSNHMHYVLFLDNDILKQPSSSNNEAALVALQLASIEPASVALNSLAPSRKNLIEYRAATLLTNAKLPLTSLEAVLNDAIKHPRLYNGIGTDAYSLSSFDNARLVTFQRWVGDTRLLQARLASRATGALDGVGIVPPISTAPEISGLQGAITASINIPVKPTGSITTTPFTPAGSHETTASNFLAFNDPQPIQPSPIVQLMMSLTPAQLNLLSTLREQGAIDSGQLSRTVAGMNRKQLESELALLIQKQLIQRASGRYKLSQWASEALWFPGKATP